MTHTDCCYGGWMLENLLCENAINAFFSTSLSKNSLSIFLVSTLFLFFFSVNQYVCTLYTFHTFHSMFWSLCFCEMWECTARLLPFIPSLWWLNTSADTRFWEQGNEAGMVILPLTAHIQMHSDREHNASGKQESCGRQEIIIRMASSKFTLTLARGCLHSLVCACLWARVSLCIGCC